MPRYVALLRAINVGGRTVKMERLRRLFEELGFDAVETFIASGNVIFETAAARPRLEDTIAKALAGSLGYPVDTFLRTPLELDRAAAASPFSDETPGALYIGFAGQVFPAAASARMQLLETDVDRFAVKGREVYWRGLNGMGQSKVSGGAIEKALGSPVTFRSITTVRKIAARYGTPPGRPRPAR